MVLARPRLAKPWQKLGPKPFLSPKPKKVQIFEGNVQLVKGTLIIRAERIVVTQDDDGYQKGVATGTASVPPQRAARIAEMVHQPFAYEGRCAAEDGSGDVVGNRHAGEAYGSGEKFHEQCRNRADIETEHDREGELHQRDGGGRGSHHHETKQRIDRK